MGSGQSLANRGAWTIGEKARGGAYRVVKIQRGSPAEAAGLEIFFDFITQIDDVPLTSPTEETLQAFFAKVNQSSHPEPLQLVVFNTRMRGFRTVILRPAMLLPPRSRTPHASPSSIFSLGLSVSFWDVGNVMSEGVRVLSVAPNSPAAHAGLIERQDWILADSQGVFRDVEDLVDSVSGSLNRHLQIFVFNEATESIREVLIVPNSEWGGEGSLGCELGSGYLHRLPFSRKALSEDSTMKREEEENSSLSVASGGDDRFSKDASYVPLGGSSGAVGEPAGLTTTPSVSRPTSETVPESGDHVSPRDAKGPETPGQDTTTGCREEEKQAPILFRNKEQANTTNDKHEKDEIYIIDSHGAAVLLPPSVDIQDAYPPYAHCYDEDMWGLIPSFQEDDEEDRSVEDEFDIRPNLSYSRGYCLYPVTNFPLKETSFPLCCSGRDARHGDSGKDTEGSSRFEGSPYFAYDLPYAAAMARHTSAVFTGPHQPGEVVSTSSLY